jgi:DNA-binding CsgD family transcriptional regulator
MEELAREVGRLARELQQDVEDLRRRTAPSNGSTGSVDSVDRLGRIERELEAVHADTRELVGRVPADLGGQIADLRRSLLVRLEQVAEPTQSTESGALGRPVRSAPSTQSPQAMVMALTPQERRVFRLCFESGFLTYREIADHLDITPSAAKNLVNRLFQSDRKRTLFAKRYSQGAARVGLQPDLQRRILGGRARGGPRRGVKGASVATEVRGSDEAAAGG